MSQELHAGLGDEGCNLLSPILEPEAHLPMEAPSPSEIVAFPLEGDLRLFN